jgi:RNA polymerase sigma-70 factor (ECF subfamily)
VKAALHRGRARLRAAAREPDERPLPVLSKDERARLSAYVDRCNARDFDAVRDMLAEEVRLELVSRTRMIRRAEVGRYYSNCASVHDWQPAAGLVDGRPALIVRARHALTASFKVAGLGVTFNRELLNGIRAEVL